MEVKLEKVREFASSSQAYRPPKEVSSGDAADIQDLDEIKLHELKEVKKENRRHVDALNPQTFRFSALIFSTSMVTGLFVQTIYVELSIQWEWM